MLGPVTEPASDALAKWAEDQRALARALDLTIEEWLDILDAASHRTTGITAAAIGASMARGLGMGIVRGLDTRALGKRARKLIDPTPPRVKNPVLKEAVRRARDGIEVGAGAARLRARREAITTPRRGEGSIGDSVTTGTPDAPGDDS
jgi:hypothetical protein